MQKSQPPCRSILRKRSRDEPHPADTKTDKDEQLRKRSRDCAQLMQAELDSASDEAPSASSSALLREIHRHIDYHTELHSQIDYSTEFLCNAECFVTSDKREPESQAVRPHAPIPPLDWTKYSSSKVCCLCSTVSSSTGHVQ
jgi:hypothetical protein